MTHTKIPLESSVRGFGAPSDVLTVQLTLIPNAAATLSTVPLNGLFGSACVTSFVFLAISTWHLATTFPQSGNGSIERAISKMARLTTSGGKMLSVANHVSS